MDWIKIRRLFKKIPILGSIIRWVYHKLIIVDESFEGSKSYWIERYNEGGDSGCGSYNKFADFKAEIINDFILENNIRNVIEYGCGDGNQLKLADYPSYIGFDVSPKALSLCERLFQHDNTKNFKLMHDYDNETADLTVSLDVVFHLVEDDTFTDYMNRLFDSSDKFVIIYSSNTKKNHIWQSAHVRHRCFSDWIKDNKPNWKLIKHIPNRYPYENDNKAGSMAEFFIYEKV